jgi:hypothetical protein
VEIEEEGFELAALQVEEIGRYPLGLTRCSASFDTDS